MTVEKLRALVKQEGRGAAMQRERDLRALRAYVADAAAANARAHAYLSLALAKAQQMADGPAPTDLADEVQLAGALRDDIAVQLRRVDAMADAAANAGDGND
jgi:hypothetical protein